MKKYCKNIDITDINLIKAATYKCLEDKYKRRDTLKILSQESGLSFNQVYVIIHRYGKVAVYWIVDSLCVTIQNELLNKQLSFPGIWYREKIDPSSFKIRRIGIQNIKQQIYDYIAMEGLKPFLNRIGQHQYASIKGRGCVKGVRQIRRWLRNKSIRYFAKADIKKCYESIPQDRLMHFLEKHIKNEMLLWLIQSLISTFESGLSIGSYLSQFLCNLYLSQLYHAISHMHRIRKSKRNNVAEYVPLVTHEIFYADDILIMGTNAKDLHKAMKLMQEYCKDQLGLTIKINWFISKIDHCNKNQDKRFIDMMGYRVYRWHITIRRRVFKRIRKAYEKVWVAFKTHRKIGVVWARRCISYYGNLKNSDSYKVVKKYHVREVMNISKRVVSNYEKLFYGKTACC